MYAIIEACGKQYKVEKGSIVYFEKLDANEGENITFDKVLLISDKEVSIGSPYVANAKVEAVVEKHVKGEKIRIFKYKAKKDYRKTMGHRQNYTKVQIKEIITK